MNRYRLGSVAVVAVAGALLFASAGASALPDPHHAILRYFGKQTSSSLTASTGAPAPENAAPAVGDQIFTTSNLYRGTARHHARRWTATAVLTCTVVGVSGDTASASCEGVIAIRGSMIVSLSTQTFSATSGPTLFPITGGAGEFLNAKGTVKAEPVGDSNNDNFIIAVTR